MTINLKRGESVNLNTGQVTMAPVTIEEERAIMLRINYVKRDTLVSGPYLIWQSPAGANCNSPEHGPDDNGVPAHTRFTLWDANGGPATINLCTLHGLRLEESLNHSLACLSD